MTNENTHSPESIAYFAELAQWKADYKELSQEIRDWKSKRKMTRPNYDPSASDKKQSASYRAYKMMLKRTELSERAKAYWTAKNVTVPELETA